MKVDYTLYLCTDSGLMSCDTVEESVERAVLGGVSVVQLREKEVSSRELFELAKRVKRVTDKYDVPLIINDRLDICLAVDAAGVHLGQTDLPCSEARRILGAEKIIGVSAATPEEAAKAESDGADYLGVGAVFRDLHQDQHAPGNCGDYTRDTQHGGYSVCGDRRGKFREHQRAVWSGDKRRGRYFSDNFSA